MTLMSDSDWRDVVGYEGYYQVSRFGEVRSLDRVVIHPHSINGVCKLKGKIIKQNKNTGGYESVTLNVESTRLSKTVHRLVAEAWFGSCPDGYECCHNDGNCTNNHVDNLRWDTRLSNRRDSIKHGTGVRYQRPVRRSDGVEFESITKAAEFMNRAKSTICGACTGQQKTSGGYTWEYIDHPRGGDAAHHTDS